MTRVPSRLLLLCFISVLNFVPFYFAAAEAPGKLFYVWRKVDECSMTRNEWLTVSQNSPGYGWEVCNGSTGHLIVADSLFEMDRLKVVICNADTPNCPRFQNDCCDVKIWRNTQTGATTILEDGESPGFGWELSPLNSPTQCCEEAAVAAGLPNCRDLRLSSGLVATFQGSGIFSSSAGPITPVTVPPPQGASPSPSKHQPPVDISVNPQGPNDDFPWEDDTPTRENEPQPPVTPAPPTPPAPQPPAADRWVLETVSVNPPDPSKVWTHPEEMKWEYSKESTSAQFTLSGGTTGDTASYQWSQPPQQVSSNGFTISIGVQSPKSSASIGISGPGSEGATIITNTNNTGGQKSATFKPTSDDFEVKVSLGWGSVTYVYKYHRG